MHARILTLTLALAAAPAAAAAAGSAAGGRVPAIVERAIEYHGGDRFDHSETAFDIASKSGTFHVEVRRDGGLYRQVVEADTDEGRRRVTVTNDAVEVTVGGEPVKVSRREEQRWRDHVAARVWFPFLPYGLANDGVYADDLGLEAWPAEGGGTRELHKVKVTFQPGTSTDANDEYLFWFDPDTGRLEQLAYSFDGGLRFRKAKSFRRVGGLLFSDQENYGIDETGRRVDEITPALVAAEMEHVSTIELRDVRVTPPARAILECKLTNDGGTARDWHGTGPPGSEACARSASASVAFPSSPSSTASAGNGSTTPSPRSRSTATAASPPLETLPEMLETQPFPGLVGAAG